MTGPGREAVARGVTGDSMAALGGRVISVVAALALSFGLFRTLGPSLYGSWSLLAALLTAATVVDFGVPGAVERGFAVSRVGGDHAAATATLAAAMWFVVGVGTLGQLVVWSSPFVEAAVGSELRAGARLLPVAFTIVLVSLIVSGALTGLRQFVSSYAWRAAGTVLGTALALWLASTGERQLDVLMGAYVSGFLVTIAGCAVQLKRHWPSVRLLSWPRRDGVTEMLQFGSALQAAAFAPFAADYAFRILAASRFGVASAGTYDLAARIAIGFRSLVSALLSALVPHAAQLYAKGDAARVQTLHRQATDATLLLMCPATALGLLVAGDLARAIVGGSAGEAAGTLGTATAALLLAHGVATMFVPALMIARAARQPWPEAIGFAVAGVVGLALLPIMPTMPAAAAALWAAHAVALGLAAGRVSRVLVLGPTLNENSRGLATVTALALVVAFVVQFAGRAAGPPLLASMASVAAGSVTWAGLVWRLGLVPHGIRAKFAALRGDVTE